MENTRPARVGSYEVLEDFTSRAASVRLLRLGESDAVEPHLHRRSTQIYVSLSGVSVITLDGRDELLPPYAMVEVPPETAHSARCDEGRSMLLNISVPPLAADDQLPLSSQPYRVDLELPRNALDVDD